MSWRVFGYDKQPLTKADFPDIHAADASHFGLFTDFKQAAAAGTLPGFSFLEPSWSLVRADRWSGRSSAKPLTVGR